MDRSDFINKQLSDLLAKYNQHADTGSLELEIRFKDITYDVFKIVYESMKENPDFVNPTLECSVNIINENIYEKGDNARYIRKITFIDGKSSSDIYMKKERLLRSVYLPDYIKYSVGLSRESTSERFSSNPNAMVRFKSRVSFDLLGKSWRFDLTAVKHGTMKDMGPGLKTIRDKMFPAAMSVDNFMRYIDPAIIDSYEIEIEYIGNPPIMPEDLSVAKLVFSLVNPTYLQEIAYQEEIHHVAEYIADNPAMFKNPSFRLKHLGNQAIALSKTLYYTDVFPPIGYYLTDKADGKRAIVSVDGKRCRIITDTLLELGTNTPGAITIVDAELVDNTLYLFDVMVIENENVSGESFAARMVHLTNAANIINEIVSESMDVKPKRYVLLEKDKLEQGFSEVFYDEYPYTIDGLILTEPGKSYKETKNYKWKPYDRNTIDFLAIVCPQELIGQYPQVDEHTLYLLFVGINKLMREKLGLGFINFYKKLFPQVNTAYFPIQFSPSSNPTAYLYYHPTSGEPIDRKVVELSRNEDNTKWIFHRVRTDRLLEKNYYGNDFRIAELTYINYIDIFRLEDLWTQSGYFTKTAPPMYTAPNRFKRYVISMLIKDNLSKSKWIIDEGAGRGGDLHRYQEVGVENALFIDIDSTAIAELIRRKFTYFASKRRHTKGWFDGKKKVRGGANNRSTGTRNLDVHNFEYVKLVTKDTPTLTVHTLVKDLKSPPQELVVSTLQYGLGPGLVDGIVCNFAFHYMCDTIEHMRGLLMFNAEMLKRGGLFIFTVMDGAKVHELLRNKPVGASWDAFVDNVKKYSIRRDYAGDTLAAVGQTISVLLPFSDEMYPEPLCNIDVVINEAKKLGFELELRGSMSEYLSKFARIDKTLYGALSADDKKYIDLHSYVSLRKTSS